MTPEYNNGPQGEQENDFEGFNKKNTERIPYFEVFDKMICRRSKTPVEGWEGPILTRNPKTNEEVASYIERYDNLVVRILNIEKYQKTFDDGGKTSGFTFTIQAGQSRAKFRLTWIEPVLKRFLKVAENIDFNRPIYISVFPSTRDGKTHTAVSFKQGPGNNPDQWFKVEEKYNKDNPEFPQAIHSDFDDTWDYKEQNLFLGQRFIERVLPKVKQIAAAHGIQDASPQQAPVPQQQAAPQVPLNEARQNWEQNQQQQGYTAQPQGTIPQYPTQPPVVNNDFGQVVQPAQEVPEGMDDIPWG